MSRGGESPAPTGLVELNGVRICALVVEGDRLAPTRRLACGTLAHPLAGPPAGRFAPPERVAVPGRPGVLVARTGWFRLLTGEVAAVFGAVVEPIG